MSGLEPLATRGGDLARVHSVASSFDRRVAGFHQTSAHLFGAPQANARPLAAR